MSNYAIQVENLGKEYIIGGAEQRHDSFRELLTASLTAPFRKLRKLSGEAQDEERFWALKDINFNVEQGEVLGIIGRNGAGKSTLLKILSRITQPTKGRVATRGRLASLLEVGTGFHPELTGRENIYLNGAILGMSRNEISKQFEKIVAFADIEMFLDTPVKRYSSGMYVRLAFAVAAHLDADILLVDEVLAVGDSEFQQRCLGRMGEVARHGRTVIFVSHNLSAIRALCTQGVLLSNGTLDKFGSIEEVLGAYANLYASQITERLYSIDRRSSNVAQIERIAVRPVNGFQGEKLKGSQPIEIIVDIRVFELSKVGTFIHLYEEGHSMVFSHGSFFDHKLAEEKLRTGTYRFKCEIPAHLLNDGSYNLDVLLVMDRREVIVNELSALKIIIEDDFPTIPGWKWRPAGVIRPQLKWMRHKLT